MIGTRWAQRDDGAGVQPEARGIPDERALLARSPRDPDLLRRRYAHHHAQSMYRAVVDQRNLAWVDVGAVQIRLHDSAGPPFGILHGDLVHATPEPPVHDEAVPGGRNAWCDREALASAPQAQNRFQTEPVHPGRRPGV